MGNLRVCPIARSETGEFRKQLVAPFPDKRADARIGAIVAMALEYLHPAAASPSLLSSSVPSTSSKTAFRVMGVFMVEYRQ